MIYLDKSLKTSLYEQLYSKLKDDILSSKLKKNSMLISVRVLAKELNVSRNTVDRAYQQLLSEGYVRAVQGAGYYVEDISASYINNYTPKNKSTIKTASNAKLKYDFKYTGIDSEAFPWSKWRNYIQNAILCESYNKSIEYETSKGNLNLRESIRSFLNIHRGVNCEVEQIIICPGTQHGMDIITNILTPNEYKVAFEDPGFTAMRNLFIQKGYELKAIPLHPDGVDDKELYNSDCNLLYITPSHQFPTGVVTTIEKRQKLLEWALEKDGYIIENDYDCEFPYGQMPIPSLQSMDIYKNVIYLGTLSKILSPSLRCAYIILPKKLLYQYEKKYIHYNSFIPTYHQIALSDFINDGFLEKHMRKMILKNERKYKVMCESVNTYLKDYVNIIKTPSGVHTLIKINTDLPQEKVIKIMRDNSIGLYGTKEYWHNELFANDKIFLLGFPSMDEEQIVNGCKLIRKVIEENIERKC